MKMFTINPAEYRDTFLTQGWVNIRNGVDPEFLQYLQGAYAERRLSDKLGDVGNTKKKDQYRFVPPEDIAMTVDLFALVTGICGSDPNGMTLSERHVNRYLPDVDPDPPAHKDRFATQIAVGLAIEVPPESHLVLYPYDHLDINVYGMSADYRASLPPERLPEVLLQDEPSAVVYDRPGDVMLFPGSSMWHRRCNAADTVVLYLKCNDFNWDPLGEDPSTEGRRSWTAALVDSGHEAVGTSIAVLSRQLEWFGRVSQRDGQERPYGKLWRQEPFPLSEVEWQVLKALEKRRTPSSAAVADFDSSVVIALAGRGAVDLLTPQLIPAS